MDDVSLLIGFLSTDNHHVWPVLSHRILWKSCHTFFTVSLACLVQNLISLLIGWRCVM